MKTLLRHIQIRNLQITPPLLLAPMAGLTHSAFRQIITRFGGAGLLSTEMLAAKRLATENPAISPYLVKTAVESPLSYQLLISAVKDVAPAVDALHKLEADAIDLNMGCPAATVAKLGAGCVLMERPGDVRRLVAEARKRTLLPLSAKIRLGIELNEEKLRSFCSMLEGEGIEMLTVHARLRDEPFARRPRWEWVAKVKEWISIPVIANGGIFSVKDAADCLRVSCADGLMLGRGAAIEPWLFAEIAREIYGHEIEEPTISLPQLYGDFTDLLNELFGPERRLGRLKKFTHYFAENYKFGHRLASRVQGSRSMEEARERAAVFFDANRDCN